MKPQRLLLTALLLTGCSAEAPDDSADPTPCPTWYADLDGDGFGNHAANPVVQCNPPPNHVQNNLDCNDQDPEIHPEAVEVCDPLRTDENCNGLADNDDPDFTEGTVEAWPDADGDGFGDMHVPVKAWCELPENYVTNGTDCDDGDPNAFPGAAYEESPDACMADADGDGWGDANAAGSVVLGLDCDDSDPDIYPGADDPFDGLDQNCDSYDGPVLIDDFDPAGHDATMWTTVSGNVTRSTQFSASGNNSMDFYGSNGIMESVGIDTSTCPQLFWRFLAYQPVSSTITPDIGDYLYFEYWNGSSWVQLDRWEGGLSDGVWHERMGVVDEPAALAPGVRVRLRGASTATSDHFYVDDFVVSCFADADGDGRADLIDCAPNDPLHWSDCGLCVDADGDGYGNRCDLGMDCDDTDPTVNPAAADTLIDGWDTNCDGIDGEPQIVDDFETGGADPAVWAVITGNVTPTTTYVGQGTTSLDFFGTGGIIESHPFDASVCPSVAWSYLAMTGGAGAADPGDFLHLEYWDGSTWKSANSWEGTTTGLNIWDRRAGYISDVAALHSGFKLRFRGASNVTSDHFYIDDVVVGCAGLDNDGDGVPNGLDCDDGDPDHWSDCGICVDADGDGYGQDCDLGPDCDDTNPNISPAAPDPVGDGIDADCSGWDGEPLLRFDFESDPFVDWTPIPAARLYWNDQYFVSGSHSLRLEANGIVELPAVAGCTTFAWEYQGKRGPQPVESNNYLHLEVMTLDGTWVPIDSWPGANGTDPDFSLRGDLYGSADVDHANFRLRFRGQGEIGDDWYIDDFVVHCIDDTDMDGVPDFMDCAVNDPLHWSDCGICVDVDGDGYGPGCDLGMDCDDADPAVHPGALDDTFDGTDQDCDGFDGGTLLFDNFEPSGPNASVWATWGGNLFTTTTYVGEGTRSIDIAYNNSVIESHPIDTSMCPAVTWRYLGMTGGGGQADPEDNLHVEYWTGTSWKELDLWRGLLPNDPDVNVWFERMGVVTDTDALHPNFRLRFRGNSNSTADHYYIDVVRLGCSGPDNDGDGIPSGLDCDDTDPDHWYDCGFCIDADGDGYGVDCDLGPDCNDTRADINPEGTDTSIDGVDQDCDGFDNHPLLADSFESPTFDSAKWGTIPANVVNTDTQFYEGSRGIYVALTGILETKPLITSSCAGVAWTFFGMTGASNAADYDDVLWVEYWDGVAWRYADAWYGGMDLNRWHRRSGVIYDPFARHSGFKLRFRGQANSSADHYYIDEVKIGCVGTDADGDGYPAVLDCDDTDFWHWSDCGLCTDLDGDGFGDGCDLGDDCDDTDPTRNPAMPDTPWDGFDSDCDELDVVMLFDDFEMGAVNSAIWSSATGSHLFTNTQFRANGEFALRVAYNNTLIESVALDTSFCSTIGFSYLGMNGGLGPADAGDWLHFEYWNGSDWLPVTSWEGGAADPKWKLYSHQITEPDAFHPGFKLRIRTQFSASNDYYYFDDFSIGCAD